MKIDPNTFSLEKISDAELQSFLEKMIKHDVRDLAAINTEKGNKQERLREIRRTIRKFKQARVAAGCAPLCTEHFTNPLYALIQHGAHEKKATLFMEHEGKCHELSARLHSLNVVARTAETQESSKNPEQPTLILKMPDTAGKDVNKSKSRLTGYSGSRLAARSEEMDEPESKDEEQVELFSFRLDVELPSGFSVVCIDLFPNPQKLDISRFTSSEGLPIQLKDDTEALINWKAIPGEVHSYELLTSCTKKKLTRLTSVLVLRIAEEHQCITK